MQRVFVPAMAALALCSSCGRSLGALGGIRLRAPVHYEGPVVYRTPAVSSPELDCITSTLTDHEGVTDMRLKTFGYHVWHFNAAGVGPQTMVTLFPEGKRAWSLTLSYVRYNAQARDAAARALLEQLYHELRASCPSLSLPLDPEEACSARCSP